MSTRKCGCVIATERNTPSVRAQAEMGGYVKHECEFHRNQRLAAGASEGQATAKQQYDATPEAIELDPLERLRFFCSLAMNGQDWLDVEPFFDALKVGASEGQAEPIYQVKRVHGWVDVPESRYTEIKEDPNDCGELRILYLHPSAELAALRERIAILEHERDEAIAAEEKVQELHDALFERITVMEKDAEIGHALIANGLYDRMNDMVDEDGPAKLIEELIAVVDPILDAKFKLNFAAMKEPKQ